MSIDRSQQTTTARSFTDPTNASFSWQGYPPHEPALLHCQAYLTFLAAGLLDMDEAGADAADTDALLFASPPTTPNTALLPLDDAPIPTAQDGNQGEEAGQEEEEAAERPAWDRQGLQRHPPQLLPHLLARITGLASDGGAGGNNSSSNASSSSALASPPPAVHGAAAAAGASPMLVAATPLAPPPGAAPPILGCRSVGMGSSKDSSSVCGGQRRPPVGAAITEASASPSPCSAASSSDGDGGWDEEKEEAEAARMDDSASFLGEGTDYDDDDDEEEEEEEEGEEEEEEDHPFSRRYLRTHVPISPSTTATAAAASTAPAATAAPPSLRLRLEAPLLPLLSGHGDGGVEGEDELQWSAATTTDAACSQDSLFAFFDIDEEEEGEGSKLGPGLVLDACGAGYQGDGEGGSNDGQRRRRRRRQQRQAPHEPQWQIANKRFASPEDVGAGRSGGGLLLSPPGGVGDSEEEDGVMAFLMGTE